MTGRRGPCPSSQTEASSRGAWRTWSPPFQSERRRPQPRARRGGGVARSAAAGNENVLSFGALPGTPAPRGSRLVAYVFSAPVRPQRDRARVTRGERLGRLGRVRVRVVRVGVGGVKISRVVAKRERLRLRKRLGGFLVATTRADVGLQERVLEELLVGHASRRVLLQQPAHQVHALARQLAGDTTRDARVPARDVAQERHRVGARERRRAAHELEQDTPDAPEVRLGVVLLVAQDLRRHVQGRAAQRLGQTARVHVPREAKVGDLERRGGIRRVLLGAERRLLGSRSGF